MSVKIMTNVWERSSQQGTRLIVLLALADHADDYGVCWPGLEKVGQKARVQKRQAINIIQKLEADGEIIVIHNRGRRQSNRYLVTIGFSAEEIYNTLTTHPELKISPVKAREILEKGVKNYTLYNEGSGEKVQESAPIKKKKVQKITPINRKKGAILNQKGAIAIAPEPMNHHESTTTTTIPAAGENQSTPTQDNAQLKDAIQTCGELYETYFGSLKDPLCREDFIQALRVYGPGAVESAVRVAIVDRANGKTKTWGYVKSILEGEHNGQNGQAKTHRGKSETNGASPGAGHQNGRGTDSHRNTRGRRGRKRRDDPGGLLGDVGPGGGGNYQWIFDILDQPGDLGEL